MLEQNKKRDEAAAAFRAGLPYIDSKLVTSDKMEAGSNAGGVLFSEIIEVPMSMRESFANSRAGRFVATTARRVLPSRV